MRPQPRYQPGDRIAGRYQIHQALMGGMGEVYLCLDLETIQPVALKTFQQHYLTNPKVRELFEEEVATWVVLEKHPNIVRCFYMDTLDNQPFMFLEWIAGDESRGTDLRSWLRRGPLDLRLALDFTIDICRGLIHAGQKQPGIVHRDLKPENILVAQGRLAKITDWGLAKIVQEAELEISGEETEAGERQSLMGAGGIVGTPAYMAPEQWRGEELDARTDIYALGCILYEMLVGRRPFEAARFRGLRRQHLEAPASNVTHIEALPPALDRKLLRCLAKRREDRFAAVEELLHDLSQVYQQRFGEVPKLTTGDGEFTAIDYNNRGTTYAALQRYEEALADYNRAIELKPTAVEIYNNRGVTLSALQRYDKALADYDKALQLNRSYVPAYNNRGNVYEDLGQYEKALADYDRSIELEPTAEIYNNRGFTNLRLNEYAMALADFGSAIQVDPDYVQAYHNRAATYVELGQLDEALADYTRIIQLDPADPNVYFNIGLVLVRRGVLDPALMFLERATMLGHSESQHYAVQVRQMLNSRTDMQLAFEAFEEAGSAVEMQDAVARFPFMADVSFITTATSFIAELVPPSYRPDLELRLAWLRQIADEQKWEEQDQ